jgi:biotin transport system substrate-specific component
LTKHKENPVRLALFGALFAALTACGAFIRIPIPAVPVTLQTLFVFLSGGLLGSKTGFLSQCIYLTMGLIGLPVFSGSGGLGYVFHPSFGYLVGFPFAAALVGILVKMFQGSKTRKIRSKLSEIIYIALIYSAGSFIIYVFGIFYLSYYTYYIIGQELHISNIIWAGCIIFIPTDIIKIIIGSWLTVKLQNLNFFYHR